MFANRRRATHRTDSPYHTRIDTICAGFFRTHVSYSTETNASVAQNVIKPIVTRLLCDAETSTAVARVARGVRIPVSPRQRIHVFKRWNLLGGLNIALFQVCHSCYPDVVWRRLQRTFGTKQLGNEEILDCISFGASLGEDSLKTLNRLLQLRGSSGKNGFVLACERGQEDMIRLLVTHTRRLGLRFDYEFLVTSAIWKNPSLVRLFVKRRNEIEWDVNGTNKAGLTVLYYSATRGYLESVRILVESAHETGLQVNDHQQSKMRHELIPAVAAKCRFDGKILKLLLENAQVLGIDMNNISRGASAKDLAETFWVKKSAEIFKSFAESSLMMSETWRLTGCGSRGTEAR